MINRKHDMPMEEVTSSNLRAIGHRNGVLRLDYADGAILVYLDVDAFHYRNMLECDSIGAYINRRIKGNFSYMLIKHPDDSWQSKVLDLLGQIEMSDYTDEHGHNLKMNSCYIKLKEHMASGGLPHYRDRS